LKEIVKLPTGVFWLSLAIAIFPYWSVIGIDHNLIPSQEAIDNTITGFAQIFPYITILTVVLTTTLHYVLYFFNIVLSRRRDSKYNSILESKDRDNLDSYDFIFIKDIVNKFENKMLLCLGTLIISVYFLPNLQNQ
jgi:hypothetical protein